MPLTDYYRNKLIDLQFRAQAYAEPSSYWVALLEYANPAAGDFSEVVVGGVARAEVVRSLTAFSGTQSEGSTTASNGTTGLTSNNDAIEFVAAASAVVEAAVVGIFDASSGGNLLRYYLIRDSVGSPITRTWQIGDPVRIEAGDLEVTLA